MSKTALRDAVIAELAKLGPGETGDKRALKAAIGCSAAELDAAIDALRWTGKIGFYGLVLSESMRASLAPPAAEPAPDPVFHVDAATDRPERSCEGDRQTSAMELASVPAPGGVEAQAGQPDRTQEPTGPMADKWALPPHVSGAELGAEIRAWCRAQGVTVNSVSLALTGYPGFVNSLEKTKQPSAATVAKVRAHLAGYGAALPAPPKQPETPAPAGEAASPRPSPHPDPAPAPKPLASAVREEAEVAGARRRRARTLGGTGAPLALGPLSLVERIQTGLAEEPRDLIVAIGRRHPALIKRAVLLGRATATTPAAALYSALETGLDQLEREGASHGQS